MTVSSVTAPPVPSCLQLSQDGRDRVLISGVKGEAPPEQLKVCVNELGGWRNSVEFMLTGLDVEAKAALVRRQLEAAWGDKAPADVTWTLGPLPRADADTEQGASTTLRCDVRAEPDLLGEMADVVTLDVGDLRVQAEPGSDLAQLVGEAGGVEAAGVGDDLDALLQREGEAVLDLADEGAGRRRHHG